MMRESNSRPPAPKAGIIPLDQSPTFVPSKGRDKPYVDKTGTLDRLAQNDGVYIRGGIRTRDLLLRRQTRYPLRYTDSAVQSDGILMQNQTWLSYKIPRSLVG